MCSYLEASLCLRSPHVPTASLMGFPWLLDLFPLLLILDQILLFGLICFTKKRTILMVVLFQLAWDDSLPFNWSPDIHCCAQLACS